MIAPRVLTLTTDFGTADGYVGAMKGEILRLAPGTPIVDISHDIAPQDIRQGAWCLRRAVPRFPEGTMHLAVVDPGVGTERRALLVETERFLLLGPDNGLLIWAAEQDGIRNVRAIDPARGPWKRSATFEGLSLFAVAAGHLLAGAPPESVGPGVSDWEHATLPQPHACQNGIEGEVILHDRFGNAITNLTRDLVSARAIARLEWGGRLGVKACASYGDLADARGKLGALWNSDGHLELFIWSGSARDDLNVRRGTPVRIFLAH
jgi:S-adenosylmethionine hydrolase